VPDLDDPKDLFGRLEYNDGASRRPLTSGPPPAVCARLKASATMTGVARATASLIGAPTDVGASDRGASMGPRRCA